MMLMERHEGQYTIIVILASVAYNGFDLQSLGKIMDDLDAKIDRIASAIQSGEDAKDLLRKFIREQRERPPPAVPDNDGGQADAFDLSPSRPPPAVPDNDGGQADASGPVAANSLPGGQADASVFATILSANELLKAVETAVTDRINVTNELEQTKIILDKTQTAFDESVALNQTFQ